MNETEYHQKLDDANARIMEKVRAELDAETEVMRLRTALTEIKLLAYRGTRNPRAFLQIYDLARDALA